MKTPPTKIENLGHVYSNFDHELDEEIAARLANEDGTAAEHSAWEFHGDIWREGERWFNLIMCHHCHVATIEADTLRDVIDQANAEFGTE